MKTMNPTRKFSEEDEELYEACKIIHRHDSAVAKLFRNPVILRKIRAEAAKQSAMNPEIPIEELVADAQTILWNEIRKAKGFRDITPETIRAWLETRITWRLKTHVQRTCRIKYHKKTETEEARYEKQHPDSVEDSNLSSELGADPQRFQSFELLLRGLNLDYRYKTPIKLVIIDGFTLSQLAEWYNCPTSHAGAIFKTSLQRLREYIDGLSEREQEAAMELIRELI